MPSRNTYCLTWVSLTLDVGYLFTAAPAKHSRCSLPWTRGIYSLPPLLTLNVECLLSALLCPLSPPTPVQPPLLGCGLLLWAAAPDLGCGVASLGQAFQGPSQPAVVHLITRTTAWSNSMKLSHAHGATQDGRGMVESLTECGPLEKGMANHFSILAWRTP